MPDRLGPQARGEVRPSATTRSTSRKYLGQAASYRDSSCVADGARQGGPYRRARLFPPAQRHQKLLEEAPSPALNSAEEREQDWRQVVINAMQKMGYRNVPAPSSSFMRTVSSIFIEMNTRLQVEHPMIEKRSPASTSCASMIRMASGPAAQPVLHVRTMSNFSGHAVECRDQCRGSRSPFLPSPGTVDRLSCRRVAWGCG